MARKLEFFFDYGSPFSYLADAQLEELVARTDAEVVYRPMLLGGVFKATGNQSPIQEACENKRNYGGGMIRRWSQRIAAPLEFNPHFPINTIGLMRGAVAAQHAGVFERYHPAVFRGMWVDELDMGKPEVVAEVLTGAGLDAGALLEAAATQEAKDELRANTEEAVERGAFGAPSFFVGDDLFFGNDHLPFVEEALRALPA